VGTTGSTTTINANITTTGNQTYSNVTLNNNVTLTGSGIANSTVRFNGTVNGNTPARGLTITSANAHFDGIVGTSNIASITVSTVGSSTTINANITTTGNQNYYGSVLLGGNITFSANSGSLIRFRSTVAGLTSDRTMTITQANVQFDGTVGTYLSNLTCGTTTTNITTTVNANITTSGNQNYYGSVLLGANITFSANTSSLIHFWDTVAGVTSNRTLAIISANVQFDGTVGTYLSSLTCGTVTVPITTTINANITTTGTGNQTYNGQVIFGAVSRILTSAGNV
jgi:hypothetical protein